MFRFTVGRTADLQSRSVLQNFPENMAVPMKNESDSNRSDHCRYEEIGDNSYSPRSLWRRVFPTGYLQELKQLLILTVPIVLTQLTQFAIPPVAMIFCGRLGNAELGAVSLANSFINVTGIIIANGLATACDTLFSQIYGSVNKHRLGIAVQKSLICVTLCVLPCFALTLNANSLLLALGQDLVVSRLAAEYLLIFSPGLLAFFIYVTLAKYLQNQNIIVPNLIIGLGANIVNIVGHYILVSHSQYGLRGSAIAQVFAYVSFMLLTMIYIYASKLYRPTWTGWSRECLHDWGQFYWLGSFGLMMFCLEWWSFEIGLFLAGTLGTIDLGAQSIIFQVEVIRFMLPMGVGIAASIRVGQQLGSGNAIGARNVFAVSMTVTGLICIVLTTLLGVLHGYLPYIFTNDPEIVKLAAAVLPLMVLSSSFDDFVGLGCGVLRGIGKQHLGAIVNFALYSAAVVLAYVLMFPVDMGVAGFWAAMGGALFGEAVIFIMILARSDWAALASNAMNRAGVEQSISLGQSEKSEDETAMLIEDTTHTSLPRRVIIRTVLLTSVFVCILVVGIICRVQLEIPDAGQNHPDSVNATLLHLPYNYTTLLPQRIG